MDWSLPSEHIVKILLAALLGFVVGLERDWSGKPAGIRTNMIIAVSSCLFTMLSAEGFFGNETDTSRVAAQIVTGVGFLGAGALIHNQSHVVGLTTAANIWLVAAIGMAVGVGFAGLASFVTLLTTFSLLFLKPLSHWLILKGQHRAKKYAWPGE